VYRDFHEVPRVFYVEHDGRYFLFDCEYDERRGDYAPGYTVYVVPKEAVATPSWQELAARSVVTGWLPLDAVEFDETKQRAMLASVLQHLH
jgi:hypothetical protein